MDVINIGYLALLLLLLPFILVRSIVVVLRNVLIIQMLLDLLKKDDLKTDLIEFLIVRKLIIKNVITRTKETLDALPKGTSSNNNFFLKKIIEAAKYRELFFEKKLDYIICNIEKFIKINLIYKFIYLIFLISLQVFSILLFCSKFREVLAFLNIL